MSKVESIGHKLLIVDLKAMLASASWGLMNNQMAEQYASEVVAMEKVAMNTKPIADAYSILSEIASQKQNYSKAIEYLKLFFQAEKKHFEEINGRQLAVESAKRQSAEKDAQIDLLNKQNSILVLQQRLAEETVNSNRWIIGSLSACMAMLIAWTINVRRSQRKLKYLAEYDSLTSVSNRAHFTRSSSDLLNMLRKSEREASVILFDLDHFKKINDTYGHLIGDQVLKLAATACSESIRRVDILGRVGGEEFAILLPGCDLEQAERIAEDCRRKVHEINTEETGYEFEVSGSFGVSHTNIAGFDLKDLMASADEAMYLAKRRGRNMVVIQNSNKSAS